MERPSGKTTPADLSRVRRFEAAGFRAWPAQSVRYDGAWAVRLTEGHPAKRLNSVNPLDPGDHDRLDQRIQAAGHVFESHGRTLTFRMSPLAGMRIAEHLDARGWLRLSESIVMVMEIANAPLSEAMPQIPLKDTARFIGAAIAIRNLDPALRPGLAGVIGSIKPRTGLFVLEEEGAPVSTAICVQDGQLAGLFEIATDETLRNKGHGRRIVMSALRWARAQGASMAWLQVEADNAAAVSLYETLGFRELYRYHYRQPGGAHP